MKSFYGISICFLFVFLSPNVLIAQTRTSPFDPPEASDMVFIVDDSSGLDTGCTFRNGGPLVFDIYTTRFIGEVNPDGTLKNPDMLAANKVVAESAILTFPAYDVDYDIRDRPSLIAEGINPERDLIKFNGIEINRVGTLEPYLVGENNLWIQNEFIIPLRVPIQIIKFPDKAPPGEAPIPRKNTITIDIDQDNIGNIHFGTDQFWCTSVDWAALTIEAMPPVVLIQGNGRPASFWDKRGFTQVLKDNGIPYDNSLVLPHNTVPVNGKLLNTEIPKAAKRMGVQNVQLVAHSKGGLDAREFLGSYYSALESSKELKVHTFITLSTPHKGSVGADYIGVIKDVLDVAAFIGNPNARTRFTEWFTGVQFYGDAKFEADRTLSTSWVTDFNRRNRLPSGIKYKSVAADANIDNSVDADGNGTLERNEYLEMLEEAGLDGIPDVVLVDWMMNIMYQAMENFSSASASFTGRYYFLPNYPRPIPIWALEETPTATFQENDMMVTIDSARYTFEFIKQFDKNHASIVDSEVAAEGIKHLKYAP